MIHFKGELCDGHIHMTSHELCEHNVKEHYEKDLCILKKLANNPILTDEIKNVVWSAIHCYQDKIMWRSEYIRVRNENKILYESIKEKDKTLFVYRNLHKDYMKVTKELREIKEAKNNENKREKEEEKSYGERIADEICKKCF